MISEIGWMREGNTRSFKMRHRGFLTVHNSIVKFTPKNDYYDNHLSFAFDNIKEISTANRRGIIFELKDGRIYTFACCTGDVAYVNELSNIHRVLVGKRRNQALLIQLKTLLGE